jgi:signal transduction histidine kinase
MLIEGPQRQSRSTKRMRPWWRRYGYALLASCVATGARLLLGDYYGDTHRFPMLYMAVLFGSWYGGLGPGLLALALGGLSAALFHVEPGRIVTGFAMANLEGLEFYFLVAVTVLILFEAERRARQRAIEAEERLREAQKLESIGLLAGGVAHDFNNILTGVLGNASLALERMPAENGARGLIKAIISSAERAAQLTAQLLAYAGKGGFVRAPVDISQAVRRALEEVRAAAPLGIEFQLELAEGLRPVMADPEQIRQVVAGLVMNSVEAIGGRPGRVTIRTAPAQLKAGTSVAVGKIEDGEYVCLCVEDTGSGMDQSTMARIFEPFFTTKFMGRGLGLAAVAGIVRALDGAVRVWSEVAEGTRMEVCVPPRPRHTEVV